MNTFLEKLADEVLKNHGTGLQNLCVVFPSRRATVFFKKYLSQRIEKPTWSPKAIGIQDFISMHSPYIIADKLTLIFELFEVYKKYRDDTTFDEFYAWGELLLSDFDDIDKNLAPADYIFRVIREQKELDEEFPLDENELGEFKKFWRVFSDRKILDLHKDFKKTWEILGKVYHDYRSRLMKGNIAYEGMAYRKIYELARTNNLEIEFSKIIFAGFNALNKAEEGIIKELLKKGIAEIFFDADEYYLNDKINEAGNYIRKNIASFGLDNSKWTGNELLTEAKNITAIGVPLNAGQAKAAGYEIEKIISQSPDSVNSTAVVLPDESFLIPMLHSLPENISALNVTMGYPMKNSPLYNLILLLKNLQKNKKNNDGKIHFYHKDVIGLLLHPYIKFRDVAGNFSLVNKIKKNNIVYVPGEILCGDELLKKIFCEINSPDEALNYLYELLNLIAESFEERKSKLELEYVYTFYTQLNLFKDVLAKYHTEIETETFWKLLLEAIALVRIPFAGEPLNGLQVMGVLETRSLDFENVFILSMNEGTMPRGNTRTSFIPYRLRKAFKLPTHEDEDSISAYYFYRLMQKAKNIFLLYNTEIGDIASGEKSRLIMQVENELAIRNTKINFTDNTLQIDSSIPAVKEINVEKTKAVIDKLLSCKEFSPTALGTYIRCPLQFYLKYIAGLKEEDTIEEFFSGGTLGRILHGIMEILYTGYKDKPITIEVLDELSAKLDKNYDLILGDAFKKIDDSREFESELQGKNLLYKGIIKKLAERIIETDKKSAPFMIHALEEKIVMGIETPNGKSALAGRVDRIDSVRGRLRIIDYKTGKVDVKDFNNKDLPQYFSEVFTSTKYKEVFQTYCYAYLYLNEHPGTEISIGLFTLRNMNEGIKIVLSTDETTEEKLRHFESGLKQLYSDIFNPQIPFSQTKDPDNCKWCPFKSICYRD